MKRGRRKEQANSTEDYYWADGVLHILLGPEFFDLNANALVNKGIIIVDDRD